MLFDLFIFLSSPSMCWTCAFTPTQEVSWPLEWYMYTLSYIVTLRQNLIRKFVNATQVGSYLPSSYSLSPIYSEHDNTQLVCNKQWYVQSWIFYWCCDDVDIHQSVMRLHTIMILIIRTLQLFKHSPPFPAKMSCILNIRTPTFEIILLISKHLHLAELEWESLNF